MWSGQSLDKKGLQEDMTGKGGATPHVLTVACTILESGSLKTA